MGELISTMAEVNSFTTHSTDVIRYSWRDAVYTSGDNTFSWSESSKAQESEAIVEE